MKQVGSGLGWVNDDCSKMIVFWLMDEVSSEKRLSTKLKAQRVKLIVYS